MVTTAYVLNAIVTDSATLDFLRLNGILYCAPSLEPSMFPSVRAVEQEQVYVSKATGLNRLLDSIPRGFVG